MVSLCIACFNISSPEVVEKLECIKKKKVGEINHQPFPFSKANAIIESLLFLKSNQAGKTL